MVVPFHDMPYKFNKSLYPAPLFFCILSKLGKENFNQSVILIWFLFVKTIVIKTFAQLQTTLL